MAKDWTKDPKAVKWVDKKVDQMVKDGFDKKDAQRIAGQTAARQAKWS